MCLDFTQLDLSELQNKIGQILTPSKESTNKFDPIWGKTPKSALPYTLGHIKHGNLIEKTIIKLVRASTQWEGIQSYKLQLKDKVKEFDNIVFNEKLRVIIILECKRDVNNISGPYKKNIDSYIEVLPNEVKSIMFSLFSGFSDYKVYFAIFNAYGAHKEKYCGMPVIEPKHLNEIFSECVSLGWEAFEKEKYDFFKKNDIPMSEPFEVRVGRYKNFQQLEKYFSDGECDVKDSLNLGRDQSQLDAIDRILGQPIFNL